MCTLLTVSREFYDKHKDEVLWRIKMDAQINKDGFSIITLGSKKNQTVKLETLELQNILTVIEHDKNWTRFFFHARAATTSQAGIFGCHNFSTVAKGNHATREHWLVQHNGILTSAQSELYMVDTMEITERIALTGVIPTIEHLHSLESYANAFLVNPDSGEYHVVRCVVGTLYTDDMGNFSSKPCGVMKKPVPHDSHYPFIHEFEKDKTEYVNAFAAKFWANNPYFEDEEEETSSSFYYDRTLGRYTQIGDEKMLTTIDTLEEFDITAEEDAEAEQVENDIAMFGEEALLVQEHQAGFVKACELMGFGVFRKIPNRMYSLLTIEQKGWFVHFKETKRFEEYASAN